MNIKEFRETLIENVRFNASTEETSDREEFLNYVSDALVEADELEDDIVFIPFEGVGSGQGRRKIQIDGYTYNELDEYLSLYIIANNFYGDIETLTNTDVQKFFNREKAFIEEAHYIVETAEESAPAYGLAIDIINRYANVRKYCLYILTDMKMSKNIKELMNQRTERKISN